MRVGINMDRVSPLKFQSFRIFLILSLSLFFLVNCQNIWASQDALVISEKATVYADEQMTSPIGFVRKGKKIKVGEIARNKAQVYPIIISGRVAYIRVLDVSTEKEAVDSDYLIAERFIKSTRPEYQTKYVLGYYSFASQISQKYDNSNLKNGDGVGWNGLSLKGEVLGSKKWDVLVIMNYMDGKASKEDYRVFEVGGGAAYRLVEAGKFTLRANALLFAIPFSTYSIGNDFRKRGYGFTLGAGLDVQYLLTEHWGVELGAGVYSTRLYGPNLPSPYKENDPSFMGTRVGLGISFLH